MPENTPWFEVCQECPLMDDKRPYRRGPVKSRGAPVKQTRLLLVGEAPGKQEDAHGVAFIGRSGDLLNLLLHEAQIDPWSYRITNTVRCCPRDKNEIRKPSKREIKICSPLLVKEIELCQPEVIVALGKVPMTFLLGLSKGTVIENNCKVFSATIGTHTCDLITTYHPAVVLRGGVYERYCILNALVRAKYLLSGGEIQEVGSGALITDTEEALKFLSVLAGMKRPIVIDLETHNTDPLTEDAKVWGIALSCDDQSAYLSLEHPEHEKMDAKRIWSALAEMFRSPIPRFVAHNTLFESFWFKVMAGTYPDPWLGDTMLQSFVLYGELESHRLDAVASRLLGCRPWKGFSGEDYKDLGSVCLSDLAQYATRDANATYACFSMLSEEIKKDPDGASAGVYDRLLRAISPLTEIHYRGVEVDVPLLDHLLVKIPEEITRLLSWMLELPEVKEMEAENKKGFNVASLPQLRTLLFEKYKLKPVAVTEKTGKESTSEESLEKLQESVPDGHAAKTFISSLLRVKKLSKLKGTYLEPMKAMVRPRTSRVTTHYLLHGTNTGRLSTRDMAIHTFTKGDVRRLVCAGPGRILVQADFSQLELRVLAAVSGDERMIEGFRSGEDFHNFTASVVFGVDVKSVPDALRGASKRANFGIVYGISARKLSGQTGLSFEEAKSLMSSYRERFPQMFSWIEEQHEMAKRCGYVIGLSGRKRWLMGAMAGLQTLRPEEEDESRNDPVGDALRQAQNHPIQSAASDICLESVIELDKRLQGRNSHLVGTIHDAIIVDCDATEFLGVIGTMREVMCEFVPTVVLPFMSSVPLDVDFQIGKSWGINLKCGFPKFQGGAYVMKARGPTEAYEYLRETFSAIGVAATILGAEDVPPDNSSYVGILAPNRAVKGVLELRLMV